jgi:TonB family protein
MPLTTPPCMHPAVPISIVGPAAVYAPLTKPYAAFKISVDANGHVTGSTVQDSSGNAAADRAAAEAVTQWTFLPASNGCFAVASTVEYTVPIGAPKQTFSDPCNHDAQVVVQAQPRYPQIKDVWRPVQTELSITLDSSGRITGEKIIQSTGYDTLDKETQSAAEHSAYFPAVHACTPTGGWYFFRVTFDPNA